MTMDLHADQIQGFFNVPVDHLYGSTLFVPYIKSLGLENLVIAAPDMGGTKRANAYSRFLNCEMVICYKVRKKANVVEEIRVIGDIKDKNIVIVDDMIDTAGTVCLASKLMMEEGALSVRVVCSHAVLSGPAYERIEKSRHHRSCCYRYDTPAGTFRQNKGAYNCRSFCRCNPQGV